MRYALTAVLCAGALALAGGAAAAQPAPGGMVLYDAAGTPVAILTPLNGAAAARADDPNLGMLQEMEAAMRAPFDGGFQRFFAAEEASMRAMQQEMRAMVNAAFRGPGQTFEVAIPPGNGQVSRVFISSFSSGQGSCSETVTYAWPSNGGAPKVEARAVGTACGSTANGGTAVMPAVRPERPAPGGTKLIEVSAPVPAGVAMRG